MGRFLAGVADEPTNKRRRLALSAVLFWLGWQDLNLRMRESKSRALPLGDTPMLKNMGRATSFELATSRATIWRSTD